MGVPKRRHSRARRDKHRSHHALKTPGFARCSHCNHIIIPHRACPNCGYYNNRSVFIPKTV